MIDAGEQDTPAFKSINPAASVPVLFVDDRPPLTQSLAILEYLEELHLVPAPLPEDPRGRARVRSLAMLSAADSHPLIVPRVGRHLAEAFGVDAAGRAAWVAHWLQQGLVQAEAHLAGDPATGRFCHGDAPTIADLCLMSRVFRARAAQLAITGLPTVEQIVETCLTIDAFHAGLIGLRLQA